MEETSARTAPRAWTNQESSTAAVKSRAELNPRLLPARVMTNVITIPIEKAPGSCLYIEPEHPVITPEQKAEALKMWKDLLKETKDYVPHQHRSREAHDKNIKFLSSAMKAFRESKLRGLRAMEWKHDRFGPIQNAMNIPKIFCMPDVFFEEAKRNQEVVYHKRCCSSKKECANSFAGWRFNRAEDDGSDNIKPKPLFVINNHTYTHILSCIIK